MLSRHLPSLRKFNVFFPGKPRRAGFFFPWKTPDCQEGIYATCDLARKGENGENCDDVLLVTTPFNEEWIRNVS